MSAFDVTVPAAELAMSAEEQLIARVQAGDEHAFESVYVAHHAALWRFAYGYVRSPEVAEELVQEVFLALWNARAGWTVRTRVRAWLYAAVRHQALNYLRHERLTVPILRSTSGDAGRVLAMGEAPQDAHEAVEAHELDDAVQRALDGLPERRRVAMTLRWKHDLSALEIAHVLGTTPEAVRVLLTRARQDLSAVLGIPAH